VAKYVIIAPMTSNTHLIVSPFSLQANFTLDGTAAVAAQ
jgi:hypothetical protein